MQHGLLTRPGAFRASLDLGSPQWPARALLLFCISSCLLTVSHVIATFDRIGEAGYGDVYILETVQQFQKTGVIYQPPGAPVALPASAIYSPLLYVLLAVPGWLGFAEDPFLGPRVIEIAVSLLCVAVTASTARALVRHPWAWRWSVLLALSIGLMREWILQIRGDFPAVLCGLVSIRLLLARSPWWVLPAGAAAGLATQFKVTYVSAAVAGALWLAAQRRWRHAAGFAAASGAASLGVLLLFQLREPHVLSQMFAIRHPIADFSALFGFIGHTVVREPVLLLAAAALPVVLRLRSPRWWLPAGYLAISLLLSTALVVQSGGHVNYYFEALFACVPLAAYGVLQVSRRRLGTAGLFLTAVVLVYLALPGAVAAARSIRGQRLETVAWNQDMRALRGVFAGTKVLSMVPTAAYLAPEIVVSEPYTVSYMHQLGLIAVEPLRKRILEREFDIVVTPVKASSWRGVPRIAPGLRTAIAETYQPACVFRGWLMHLPRQSPRPGLAEQLEAIGCTPSAPGPAW